MSAQLLEVSLLGVGRVLRLERDAWSMVQLLRQATNEYPLPPPAGAPLLIGHRRLVQVYCPKHVKDVKSCLDVEGRDSQIGPVSYQEARDRILPKLLMGYMSAAAAGNNKSGKSGRASAKVWRRRG